MDLLRRVVKLQREGLSPADIALRLGVSERWVMDVLSANALEMLELVE